MERLNQLINNSFIYRFIEWICVLSQKSFAFKVNVMMKFKENKFDYRKYNFFKNLERLGTWFDKKVKASRIYNIIDTSSGFLVKNSGIARLISKIQWIYILPFFVWVDRLVRLYELPLASLWDELYIIFLLLVIGYRRWFKEVKYRYTMIDLGLVSFIMIYLIITFLNSTDISIGLEGFRVVTQYMVTFFIVVQLLDTEKKIKTMIWLFMISLAFLGLHGTYQFFTGAEMAGNWVDSGEDITTRAFSILGNPNALASVLLIMLPVSFTVFITEKHLVKKIIALGIFIILGIGMLLTFSRGSWAAAVVSIILVLVFVGKRLIMSIGSVGLLAFFGIDSIYSRIYYLFTPEYIAKSARGGRIYRYTEALAKWSSEGKWFGLGVGRFGGAVATNHGLSPFYMDNFFLKTLAEAGVVGLSAYIALLVYTLFYCFRYILGTKDLQYRILMYGIFAGMIGVLIHNAVENVFEIPYMVTYFWTMVGLIVAMYRDDAKKRKVN